MHPDDDLCITGLGKNGTVVRTRCVQVIHSMSVIQSVCGGDFHNRHEASYPSGPTPGF